jgi:hypothetical protein
MEGALIYHHSDKGIVLPPWRNMKRGIWFRSLFYHCSIYKALWPYVAFACAVSLAWLSNDAGASPL